MQKLTPVERSALRAEAHALKPVVIIGEAGLTPPVMKEIAASLDSHGLIKVRVFSDDRAAREAMLKTLADELDAAPIQHIGKLLVLWRPMPPKEKLPDNVIADFEAWVKMGAPDPRDGGALQVRR